jgi:FdhE protein
MSSGTVSPMRELQRDHPEWRPWLTVIAEVLRQAVDPAWERLVPRAAQPTQPAPLLENATIVISTDLLHRWAERLTKTAMAAGTPQMAMLKGFEPDEPQAMELFCLALSHNLAAGKKMACDLEIDFDAFWSVAALLPVPFLHACRRRWASLRRENWFEGYCPLCGAWPAYAEIRGIDRSRYLRCGRCGEEWPCHWLHCPFCATDDHDQHVSLVSEAGASSRAIDACKYCGGYVKSFTTLQGVDGVGVTIADLASVDLDIAALEQGYRRPDGAGFALDVAVLAEQTFSQRIFSWS